MMSLTFGLFSQVSGSGPLGPFVICNMICVQSLITRCLLNFRYLNFRDGENTKVYICIRLAPHL